MVNKREPIFNLDSEEQALSDSVDRGEWQTVDNLKEKIAIAKKAVANYFKKMLELISASQRAI